MKIPILAIATLLLAGALVSACGGNDDDDGGAPEATTPVADGGGSPVGPELLEQPEPAQEIVASVTEPAAGVIEVAASGSLFANNNLAMPLGEPVTIRVANADLVTHNLRIAGLDGEYQTEDDAVTAPESVPGGETGELTFAPPVAGAYTFRCDFHPASMGGRITVE